MKERSSGETALFILVIAESRNFFDWVLPPPYEIANPEGGPPLSVAYVRRGEVQAIAATMTIGTIAALIFEDPMPFVGMAIASAFLLYQYEHALKTRGQT